MAVDDLGNARIDFVWGNMPLQPNHGDDNSARWGMSPYPGDSFADYLVGKDASYARGQAAARMQPGDMFYPLISNQLQAVDSHVIALRHRANYPDYTPGEGNTLVVNSNNWWDDNIPAYQYPNIVGLTLDEAVKQLKECGVNPALLVDLKFDNENPYDGIVNGFPIDTVNAPGADNPGVVVWKYLAPNTQIGTHWDGRPWYAGESDGVVFTTGMYPSTWVPVGEYGPNDFSFWHSFVVLQTTDPNKNSFPWWNF